MLQKKVMHTWITKLEIKDVVFRAGYVTRTYPLAYSASSVAIKSFGAHRPAGHFQRRRIPRARTERAKERRKSMEVSEKRDEKRRDGRQSDREWPAGISWARASRCESDGRADSHGRAGQGRAWQGKARQGHTTTWGVRRNAVEGWWAEEEGGKFGESSGHATIRRNPFRADVPARTSVPTGAILSLNLS